MNNSVTDAGEQWPESVRELLFATWAMQSVRRKDDWPASLNRLLRGNEHRAGFAPCVDLAVTRLSELFAGNPPVDPGLAVKLAFYKLDKSYADQLAASLIRARRDMGQ